MAYFRLRRRVALPGPFAFNISKTGISLSLKTRFTSWNWPLLGQDRPSRASLNLPGVGAQYVRTGRRKRRKAKP